MPLCSEGTQLTTPTRTGAGQYRNSFRFPFPPVIPCVEMVAVYETQSSPLHPTTFGFIGAGLIPVKALFQFLLSNNGVRELVQSQEMTWVFFGMHFVLRALCA